MPSAGSHIKKANWPSGLRIASVSQTGSPRNRRQRDAAIGGNALGCARMPLTPAEEVMLKRRSIADITLTSVALVAALATTIPVAAAAEQAKYPDLRGQWTGVLRSVPGLPGQPSFDASK